MPSNPDVYSMNSDEKDYIELFWIFFPSARDVYMERRLLMLTPMPISFDQILNSRHFNSVIYKEENCDRSINDYMKDNAQNNC
jgi:hypothetical protein